MSKVFFRDTGLARSSQFSYGMNANLRGTTPVAWGTYLANDVQGSTSGGQDSTMNTVTGATAGVELNSPGAAGALEFVTPPLAADVTISGSITFNIWAAENNMSANVATNVIIEKVSRIDGSLTTILQTTRTTETGSTVPPAAAENFSQTPAAGVACNRGDRLRFRIFGDDAGTMASGFVYHGYYSGAAGVRGDSYCNFTEALTFESDPAGSVIYFTDTASDVNPGSAVEKEAWTSRGAGVTTGVTNTVSGPTAAIQITNTAGGTAIEWYTKQLTAFTLAGMALFNIRGAVANVIAQATMIAEVAVCASDGSSPSVAGIAWLEPTGGTTKLTTTEAAYNAAVGVDDTSVSDGQRLRFRVYIRDAGNVAMGSGTTATFYYAGTSAAASGDSYVTLPQTVTEFSSARVPRSPGIDSGFGHV